jgi:signal transduction histidine kinase
MTAPRFQDRFVFAALILTLLLAVGLGANAMTTARYHRSVAEGVLRDYADFAASELANRVQGGLAQRFFPLLTAITSRTAADPLPSADAMRARADTGFWRVAGPDLAWFRVPEQGTTTVGGARVDDVSAAGLERIASEARPGFSPQSYLILRWPEGALRGRVIGLMRGADGSIAGLLLSSKAVEHVLRSVVDRAPLLPPSLTGGSRLDSVVTYEVRAPTEVAMASGQLSPSYFRATRSLGATWGDLQVMVALNESLAGRLVIGGLPRSRLPVVGALLGLTVLLIGAALMQLRRQREFARQRDEFVAGVSHELRTPLAQIRLFTETLRLGRVRSDVERDHSLTIIDRESRRLTWMVENLLAVSRVSRGVLTVSPRELDLAAELREAIEGFGPLAASRGASLEVSAPEALRAKADGEAFRQIVLNLLDNAVKYGPEGQTIRVSLDRSGEVAEIAVEDQGSGVPDAERERVFERFVRLRNGNHAGAEGTGLGLALVRELATLHGGTARVERGIDGGARFVVRLPLQAQG